MSEKRVLKHPPGWSREEVLLDSAAEGFLHWNDLNGDVADFREEAIEH